MRSCGFCQLFTENNKEKCSLRGVQSQKIYSHPGENTIYSTLEVIYAGVSQSDGKKEELGCHLRRGDGLGSMRKRVY